MKYESIESWLECQKPEMYDFVEDTQKNWDPANDYCDLDPYEKYCVYKYMCGEGRNKTVPEYIGKSWSRIEHLPGFENARDTAEKFDDKAKNYQIGDPDSSSVLLQKIYKLLWKDLSEQYFMRQKTPEQMEKMWDDGTITASDTMTSATSRFNDAMNAGKMKEIICSEETVEGKINEIRVAHGGPGQNWSEKFSIIVEAVLDEGDREKLYQLIESKYPGEEPGKKPTLPRFLDTCHMIGNYCPVPDTFNSARSAFGQYDCWDLTLMKIREWYATADKLSIYERDQLLSRDLLHNGGDALRCMRWLEYFGQGEIGWRNFVDTLLMQDYVYNEEDGIPQDNEKYYDVKPFWSKHGWKVFWSKDGWKKDKDKTIGMPKDIETIDQALKEICSRIEARSNRIVDACRSRLQLQKAEKNDDV